MKKKILQTSFILVYKKEYITVLCFYSFYFVNIL